jgi:hypothetical protein
MWPDWLGPFVPRNMAGFASKSVIFNRDGSAQRETLKTKTGDPHVTKLRVVCKTCNNGWMSRLQEEAKPILVPMLTGQTTVLPQIRQRIIARWVAMSVATGEYFNPDLAAVSQAERDFLRLKRRAPSTWRIWVGHYKREDWVGLWVHHSIPISDKKHVIQFFDDGRPRPNTQATTFVVGQIYFTVISSAIVGIPGQYEFADRARRRLFEIWPYRGKPLQWPLPLLSDEEADGISGAFFKAATRLRTKGL